MRTALRHSCPVRSRRRGGGRRGQHGVRGRVDQQARRPGRAHLQPQLPDAVRQPGSDADRPAAFEHEGAAVRSRRRLVRVNGTAAKTVTLHGSTVSIAIAKKQWLDLRRARDGEALGRDRRRRRAREPQPRRASTASRSRSARILGIAEAADYASRRAAWPSRGSRAPCRGRRPRRPPRARPRAATGPSSTPPSRSRPPCRSRCTG